MSDFTVHLLDVGAFNYGDSLLCRFGTTTILIDGGTPSSGRPSQSVVLGEDVNHLPIQDQARAILGQTGPALKVDLLVVTHCHSDHMGCLPALVASGKLKCSWALVADPALGYGITSDSDEPPVPAEMSGRDKLWLALREEPIFGGTDEEIRTFIEDTANEYQGYVTLVNKLKDDLGDQCVVYRGTTEHDSPGLGALLEQFKNTDLHIYGPSFELLEGCAQRLEGRSEDLMPDAVGDSPDDLVEAYRTAVRELQNRAGADAPDGEDGAAVNCQSLVMRVGPSGQQVLLTGDMQFAVPSVGTASAAVKQLLTAVNADAPFAGVKLPHHGATNGQNQAILKKWGPLLAISTGSKSTKHPTEPTLQALEALESDSVSWARVDMNGRCTFTSTQAKLKLTVERGELNDKTRPSARAGDEIVEAPPAPPPEPARVAPLQRDASHGVEVHVTIPHRKTRVTITIDVEPDDGERPFKRAIAAPRQRADAPPRRLGDGRQLPKLLFVTDLDRLGAKIGAPAAAGLAASFAGGPHVLVTGRAAGLIDLVRARLKTESGVKGVVLLGGYEVVPAQIISTLPRELAGMQIPDRDRLQVWSDDGYGDVEGDGVPEFPVSRIPDARSARFVSDALKASARGTAGERGGIRNIRRPFANNVFALLPGRRRLFTSQPTTPDLPPFDLAGDVLYFMLHGTASDTSVFSGEDDAGGYPVAMSTSDVPNPCPPVVFTGCCYGGLIVDARARDSQPGGAVNDLRVQDSIALTCLERGANAFVGCTGVHYSPTQGALTYFGAPLHSAFMRHFLSGKGPAEALWSAKVEYAAGIPHRPGARPEEVAYEHKTLRQFTCLGLGW